MSLPAELMAVGMPAPLADQLGYDAPATGLTATGTTQAGALALVSNVSFFGTVGSGAGAILPLSRRFVFVYNGGGNALLVYPPSGQAINSLSANTAISVPVNKGVWFFRAGTAIGAVVSA